MFTSTEYQLLDFGDARRLERFGALTLDRPCPAAEGAHRAHPDAWQNVDGQYERSDGDRSDGDRSDGDRSDGDRGRWFSLGHLPEQWTVSHGPITFELQCTPAGHLGLFPEQAANWDWIAEQVGRRGPCKVLNLFAYTGGSTLAAAAVGAKVVHVDAAQNTVRWARRNAERSGMGEKPVRWIAEDAVKFVHRELKRGNRYEAVILDPPSYGHGPRGEVWQTSKQLTDLLAMCGELTAERRHFILLTCHTPGFDPGRLKRIAIEAFGNDGGTIVARELTIHSVTGRELPSGVVLRWESIKP